jgi:hypothetical protein
MKVILAVAALLAMALPASAENWPWINHQDRSYGGGGGGITKVGPGPGPTVRSTPTVRSRMGGGGGHSFPSEADGSAKIRDGSSLSRKHNYRGIVTLVR